MSERYVSPHPKPTDAERELLDCLIEECSEVIKCATKWLRFGAKDIDFNQGDGITNDTRLALEVGDVYEVVRRLQIVGMIRGGDVDEGCRQKQAKLDRYLQFEPDLLMPEHRTKPWPADYIPIDAEKE